MIRIGTGYDLHRLVEGRPLILAGVSIEHTKGLAGHSDADVVAHAITDAILGAAALGNIGMLFPDNDPAFKDAASLPLLKEAYARVRAKGYAVVNIDCTIVAQAPKLNPHVNAMCDNIAQTLGIERSQVSIKPKTNEHVGPEGREEAISAQAVALIELEP